MSARSIEGLLYRPPGSAAGGPSVERESAASPETAAPSAPGPGSGQGARLEAREAGGAFAVVTEAGGLPLHVMGCDLPADRWGPRLLRLCRHAGAAGAVDIRAELRARGVPEDVLDAVDAARPPVPPVAPGPPDLRIDIRRCAP